MCLSFEVADPLVLVSAPLGKHGGRIGEMHGGFVVAQSGKRDFAAPGGGIGRVDSEAVESVPLLGLDIREQGIRFGQFACIDGFLRIGFQGCDLGTIAGLS